MEGEVVAVGNGRRTDDGGNAEMTLKVGDRVSSASTPATRSSSTAWST